MNCSTIKFKSEAFLADELPAQERSSLRQHLEHCPDCQAELDSLEQLNHLLDLQPIAPVPANLGDAIMAAIAQEGTQRARDLTWSDIIIRATTLIAGLSFLFVPAFIWYWQRTTGVLPWQSLGLWGSTAAGGLASASSTWLAMVTSSRLGLLTLPKSISLWLQAQLGSLTFFYAGHLAEVVLVVLALVAAAVLSARILTHWTKEWQGYAGIKGWRN